MGGVDKSDQYLAYHNVLQKTVRYWKTLFYHMIDMAVVNAFVLYNHLALLSGCRTVSENDFCDELVLQIIDKYGKHSTPDTQPSRPSRSDCRVRHGSIFSTSKRRCQYCKLVGKPTRLTQRKCPDCIAYGLHTMNQSSSSSRELLQELTLQKILELYKGQDVPEGQ